MRERPARPLLRLALAAAVCGWLGACETATLAGLRTSGEPAAAAPGQPVAASVSPDAPKDDLTLAKEQFRAENYGLAELHFRKAAEARPGDAEAWMGLAAAYDQLRRFPLADRAYAQAFRLVGPTPELLNNRGYSYMLRGDLPKASRDLAEAARLDPADERIRNNLRALDGRARRG